MSKIYIWIGEFPSEAEFEKYMDQSAFRQWWAEHDEDNLELSCPFCKELGLGCYDEDFLIMKYSPQGPDGLLNLIPANTQKLKEAMAEKGITHANAVICYNCGEEISPQRAPKSVSVTFLGSFKFELENTGTDATTAGVRYMAWIGTTTKSKKEFMEYFNQDLYLQELKDYEEGKTRKRPNPENRCQFCKDIDIKFYYPQFLRIKICETVESPLVLLREVIQDNNIPDRWIEFDLEKYNIDILHINCAFCYVPNGFRDKKKDQKVYIVKEDMKGLLGIPKKHVNELSSYNGLTYLGTYKWE